MGFAVIPTEIFLRAQAREKEKLICELISPPAKKSFAGIFPICLQTHPRGMQDFQPRQRTDRIFASVGDGTSGGWDDRRFRAFPSAAMAASPHHPPPPLKCPRCDSQNTKFCYYNNYNLAQPRHFCKSCRRYWTKGGVLRNVPVGGGCRKPKRSSNSKSRRSSATASGSDSSAILPNSSASNPDPPNPSLHQPFTPNRTAEIFPDGSGTFSNLLSAASNRSIYGLSFVDPTAVRAPDPRQKVDKIASQDTLHQMVAARADNSAIEWPPAMDSNVYELAGAADPAAFWSQSHWIDGDPSLYLP